MKKSHIISFVIFLITYLLPFRYAVLEVKSSALSSFGVLFTAIGFLAGFYYLLKDDEDKKHEQGGLEHH
ncbi:MAG: hypothetical protein HKL88_10835 [Bacteroidia bacterium]|nr:hypothetical protein [Bacteroidia bacterium]